MQRPATWLVVLILAGLQAAPAIAQQSTEDLAKQLANPVAALISVPFQLNFDQDIGPVDDSERRSARRGPVGLDPTGVALEQSAPWT